jgi:phenylpropionate dioxygenase-like ring-hydroxylating dioxygenase large terminal subunit
VHQEDEFFDIDKAELGLASVHCDVWAGFIFVNVAPTPHQSLREYLGPMIGALEEYPFDLMTERYSFRAENNSNWKVFIDAFQEYYHVPPLHTHQLGPVYRNPEATFEGAHYQLDGPHRVVSTSGSHKHTFPPSTSTRARRGSVAATPGRGTHPSSIAASRARTPAGSRGGESTTSRSSRTSRFSSTNATGT